MIVTGNVGDSIRINGAFKMALIILDIDPKNGTVTVDLDIPQNTCISKDKNSHKKRIYSFPTN